jgi:hypothetical protein
MTPARQRQQEREK